MFTNYKIWHEEFKNQVTPLSKEAKSFLESRGISFEIAVQFKIGVASILYKDIQLDIVTFIMKNHKGEFIGIKYRPLGYDIKDLKTAGIQKSMAIKGSNVGLLYSKDIINSNVVYLCEGETDGLSLISLGFQNVICNLGGAGACTTILKDLCKDKKVICLYDNDDAGLKGMKALVLEGLNIYTIKYPGKDINDLITKSKFQKDDFLSLIANAQKFEGIELKSLTAGQLEKKLGRQEALKLCSLNILNNNDRKHWRRILGVLDPSPTKTRNDNSIAKAKLVPIQNIFDVLGVAIKDTLCKCVFHEDATASLRIYEKTNSFYCFGCKKTGDQIHFVKEFKGLSFLDAVKFVNSCN